MERLEQYLRKDFTWKQVIEIGWGIEHGLSDEQISSYADAKNTSEQMGNMRWILEQENRYHQKFSYWQKRESDVRDYADPRIRREQMKEIREDILRDRDEQEDDEWEQEL